MSACKKLSRRNSLAVSFTGSVKRWNIYKLYAEGLNSKVNELCIEHLARK